MREQPADHPRGISRRDILRVTGAAAVAAIAGGYSSGAQAAAKPIKVGASVSLTGRYARSGEEMYKGYTLWAENLNKMGHSFGKDKLPNASATGLLGRPVELIVLDDRSDPTTGVQLYNELIHNRRVDLLLGPYSSAVSLAVAPIIERNQIPAPIPMAASSAIWIGRHLQWQVQVPANGSARLPGVIEFAKDHGDQKVAIVYEDTEFPRSVVAGLRDRVKKAGLQIVQDEAYPTGITDWTAIVQRAKSAGATVLTGGGYLPDALGITRAVRALNYKPHILSLLTGVALPDFIQTLGDGALTATGDADWVTDVSFPGAAEFTQGFQGHFGHPPDYHAAAGYGGAQLLEEAVRRAGTISDLEKVRNVMFEMQTTTIFNSYHVAPLSSPDSGMQLDATRFMLQVQKDKNGKLYSPVVYPSNAAKASWIYPFA